MKLLTKMLPLAVCLPLVGFAHEHSNHDDHGHDHGHDHDQHKHHDDHGHDDHGHDDHGHDHHGHDHHDHDHLGAHEHGVLNLELAQDGDQVLVSISLTMDEVVGFEHLPKNDAERQQVTAAGAVLASDHWFRPNPSAQCELVVSEHELVPVGDHADWRQDWLYECRMVSMLSSLDVENFMTQYSAIETIRYSLSTAKGQNSGSQHDAAAIRLP